MGEGEAGFLILEGAEEERVEGERPFDGPVNREWEIVTVEEVRRRLSLDLSPAELPIPEGATASDVLSEPMIRQVLEVLPPRAESYPWHLVPSPAAPPLPLLLLSRPRSDLLLPGERVQPVDAVPEDGGVAAGAVADAARRPGHGRRRLRGHRLRPHPPLRALLRHRRLLPALRLRCPPSSPLPFPPHSAWTALNRSREGPGMWS